MSGWRWSWWPHFQDGGGKSFDWGERDHREADSCCGQACAGGRSDLEHDHDHDGDYHEDHDYHRHTVVRNSNADDNDDDYVLPGWKFGGPNLCEDDAEAFDGASRLWPGAQEECDGKHFEEPREDLGLCEERGDVVSINEEKTTHIKWTSNGTDKSRENLIILKKTSMRVFYVNICIDAILKAKMDSEWNVEASLQI